MRELKGQLPSKDNYAEAEAALESKWEGIRSLAAQVLGLWGGRHAVDVLKRALLAAPPGSSLRRVAMTELGRCVGPEDTGWILDLYFDGPLTGLDQHYVRRELLSKQAGPRLRDRVRREASSEHAGHRLAAAYALVFAATPVPGAKEVLHGLSDDPVRDVSRVAQLLSHHPNAA